MGTTLEDLREQIRREERVAGLRADGHVTDAAIKRRRLQIALVSVVSPYAAARTYASTPFAKTRL